MPRIAPPSPVDALRAVIDTMPEHPSPEDWQRLADACERAGMYALGRAVEGDHAAQEASPERARRRRSPG